MSVVSFVAQGMRMADIRVGMRLRSTCLGVRNEAIVTELTERGFKYRIPDDEQLIHPHWSMPTCRDGHEHYGLGGWSYFERADDSDEGTRILHNLEIP